MFVVTIHHPFKVGDTIERAINPELGDGAWDNKEPHRLTWRDANTLVIEPDDARRINKITRGDGITFWCSDRD
jgi:hypothetical protein